MNNKQHQCGEHTIAYSEWFVEMIKAAPASSVGEHYDGTEWPGKNEKFIRHVLNCCCHCEWFAIRWRCSHFLSLSANGLFIFHNLTFIIFLFIYCRHSNATIITKGNKSETEIYIVYGFKVSQLLCEMTESMRLGFVWVFQIQTYYTYSIVYYLY